jgi:hypothetical protein
MTNTLRYVPLIRVFNLNSKKVVARSNLMFLLARTATATIVTSVVSRR